MLEDLIKIMIIIIIIIEANPDHTRISICHSSSTSSGSN